MRNPYALIAAFLGCICLLSCQSKKSTSITKIDKAYLKENVLGKEVQLVDVRTPAEYNAGHIDDALNFDISDGSRFMEQIKTLDKEQPVYLYCKMGGRSNRAAELLQKEGFTQIFDYAGGYSDWMK